MTKTFVICVGSQKAGTSWLWHYLRQNPSIHLGFKKELHTWDATTIDEYAFFRSNLKQIASNNPEKLMQLSFMQKTGFCTCSLALLYGYMRPFEGRI